MRQRYEQVEATRDGAPRREAVAREAPLTIRVAGRHGDGVPRFTTLRTPGHDLDLALGWCVSEGLVATMADVVDVHHCRTADGTPAPDDVTVRLDRATAPASTQHGRPPATAACGLCGRDDLHDLLQRCPPAPRQDVTTTTATLTAMLAGLPAGQPLFAATGGTHAAALATADGEVLHVREDVGRHNAVDAAVGAATRAGHAADVLLLSGRAGYELIAKAVAARVAVVASVGATTDLAVRAADAAGITLVTFLGRSHGGTVLTRPDRLGAPAGALAAVAR